MIAPLPRALRCLLLAWAGCAASAAAPSGVRAFADANFFAFAPGAGGAGGRYFTGSPLDGYSCNACHGGGLAPAIHVLGLPLSGYVPSARYEITVDWSDDLAHLSAALELTDKNGQRAGTLRLPTGAELQDPERCDSAPVLGAEVIRVPPEDQADQPAYCGDASQRAPVGCRQVVHVSDCGSQRVRLLWTAPSWDIGPVVFAGSAVASNDDSTNGGDGVTDFKHVLSSATAPDDSSALSTHAGCSALPGRPARRGGWLGLAVMLCLYRSRRRRARAMLPLMAAGLALSVGGLTACAGQVNDDSDTPSISLPQRPRSARQPSDSGVVLPAPSGSAPSGIHPGRTMGPTHTIDAQAGAATGAHFGADAGDEDIPASGSGAASGAGGSTVTDQRAAGSPAAITTGSAGTNAH